MQYKKLIQQEIDFTKSFRLIAQAYEEIAVMKMRKVRNSVVQAREYFAKLSDVFLEVRRAYEKQKKEEEIRQKKIQEKSKPFLRFKSKLIKTEKLPRMVSIFLSANTTLYGDIIERIFDLFIKSTAKESTEIIIIGRLGRRLYEEQEIKKPYLYFELPDFEVSLENLKPVIYHLVKYKSIMVYYGKFENLINQQATVSNISGDQPFTISKVQEEARKASLVTKFLFEPSLQEILTFFEDLMTSALFRQTVYETQLARWASRIMAMEKAQVNIETQIKRLRFLNTKVGRTDQQKKQLERLSGISLWRS